MGIPIFKVIYTFLFFYISVVLGVVTTIIRPLKYTQRKTLEHKVHDLTNQAVESLKCGAYSTNIILPTTSMCLHVVEAGSSKGKEIVILLHGFPDTWYGWNKLIPSLVEAGYHVVVPDMRGYNLSEKPDGVDSYKLRKLSDDVLGIIQYYKKEKVYLAAHDWGGVVAWNFATFHPELLHKLVILNSPYPAAYQRELRRNLSQLLSSWYIFGFQIPIIVKNLLTFDPLKTINYLFFSTVKLTQLEKEVLASSYVQPKAMDSMLNYYKALVRGMIFGDREKTQQQPSQSKRVEKKVVTPTLVLWGLDDPALLKEVADCSQWVPNLRVHYIEKCSHWVMHDAPVEAVEQMIGFFKS